MVTATRLLFGRGGAGHAGLLRPVPIDFIKTERRRAGRRRGAVDPCRAPRAAGAELAAVKPKILSNNVVAVAGPGDRVVVIIRLVVLVLVLGRLLAGIVMAPVARLGCCRRGRRLFKRFGREALERRRARERRHRKAFDRARAELDGQQRRYGPAGALRGGSGTFLEEHLPVSYRRGA